MVTALIIINWHTDLYQDMYINFTIIVTYGDVRTAVVQEHNTSLLRASTNGKYLSCLYNLIIGDGDVETHLRSNSKWMCSGKKNKVHDPHNVTGTSSCRSMWIIYIRSIQFSISNG